MPHQAFSYDEIVAQLLLLDKGSEMRAGWTYSDSGQAPVSVVIYDRPAPNPYNSEYEQHQRRLIVIQGFRPLADVILEHMQGWD